MSHHVHLIFRNLLPLMFEIFVSHYFPLLLFYLFGHLLISFFFFLLHLDFSIREQLLFYLFVPLFTFCFAYLLFLHFPQYLLLLSLHFLNLFVQFLLFVKLNLVLKGLLPGHGCEILRVVPCMKTAMQALFAVNQGASFRM